MRNIRIPSIRLDKTNVDAPTINRALDNIISNVNTLANETSIAIDAIELQQNPVDVLGGSGISVIESPTNTFTITNTAQASVDDILAGTGISVVESPLGTFTITNTLPENTSVLGGTGISVVQSPAGTFTITNTLPENTNVVAGQGINVTQSPAGTFTIDNTAPFPTAGYVQADTDQELSLTTTPTPAYNWTATTALNMGVQGTIDEEIFSALYSQARYTLDGTPRIFTFTGSPRAIIIDIEYDNGDPISQYVIGPYNTPAVFALGNNFQFSRSGIVEVFGNRSIVVKLSVDAGTAVVRWTTGGVGNEIRIGNPLRLTINNIT